MKHISSMIEISPEDLEQIPLPSLKEGLAMGGALLLALALATQGDNDPSPLNLVSPAAGISNWFGLTGSLLAGGLLDLFGHSAYALPLLPLLLRFAKPTPLLGRLLLQGIWFLSLVLTLGFALHLAGANAAPWVGVWGMGVVNALSRILGNLLPLALCAAYGLAALPRFRPDRTCLLLLLLGAAWLAKRSGGLRQHWDGAAGQFALWLAKGQALLQRSRASEPAPAPAGQPSSPAKPTGPAPRPQDLLHQALAAFQDQEQNLKDSNNKE